MLYGENKVQEKTKHEISNGDKLLRYANIIICYNSYNFIGLFSQ